MNDKQYLKSLESEMSEMSEITKIKEMLEDKSSPPWIDFSQFAGIPYGGVWCGLAGEDYDQPVVIFDTYRVPELDAVRFYDEFYGENTTFGRWARLNGFGATPWSVIANREPTKLQSFDGSPAALGLGDTVCNHQFVWDLSSVKAYVCFDAPTNHAFVRVYHQELKVKDEIAESLIALLRGDSFKQIFKDSCLSEFSLAIDIPVEDPEAVFVDGKAGFDLALAKEQSGIEQEIEEERNELGLKETCDGSLFACGGIFEEEKYDLFVTSCWGIEKQVATDVVTALKSASMTYPSQNQYLQTLENMGFDLSTLSFSVFKNGYGKKPPALDENQEDLNTPSSNEVIVYFDEQEETPQLCFTWGDGVLKSEAARVFSPLVHSCHASAFVVPDNVKGSKEELLFLEETMANLVSESEYLRSFKEIVIAKGFDISTMRLSIEKNTNNKN